MSANVEAPKPEGGGPGDVEQTLWSWFQSLRFLQLTLFIVGLLLATPLRLEYQTFSIFLELVFLNVLLVTLLASGARSGWRWTLLTLWFLGTGLREVSLRLAGPDLHRLLLTLAMILFIILLGLVIALVFGYIFRSGRVNLDVIFAAVVAYFLLAILFSQAYSMVILLEPQSFHLPGWVAPDPLGTFDYEMLYFSLVTIATLGYGDIVPRLPFAQMLAVCEAVMGQFFIALVMSWLVGLYVSHTILARRQKAAKSAAPDEP